MSHPPSATKPTTDHLVRLFEKGIVNLIQRFLDHPYTFYTESDMHCYLYHLLCSEGLGSDLYKTAEGYETILLHKEFPTTTRYFRHDDRTLEESEKGRRGAFDLCLWNPETIGQYEHRKQKVLCAAELALNECGPGSVHTLNDATKLTGPGNAIKHGYVLFFVRDNKRFEVNEKEINENLEDAAVLARVALVRVDGAIKHEPKYRGNWVTVPQNAPLT